MGIFSWFSGKSDMVRKLNDSILSGNIAEVVTMLKKHSDLVHQKIPVWGNALSTASILGKNDIIILLIEEGAKINAPSDEGYTPLIFASMSGNAIAVRTLIKNGAIIHVANKYGMTPLGAASLGKMGREMIKGILKECQSSVSFDETTNYIAIIEDLLNHGAEVNPTVADGRTPLYTACGLGNTEIVKLLIDHGADINIKATDGTSPIMVAESEGHAEIVKLLRRS